MVSVSFTPTASLVESVVASITREQRVSPSFSRLQRAIHLFNSHGIKWLFPLLVMIPTIVIMVNGIHVSGLALIYFIVVSWAAGGIAQHTKERDSLRSLMMSILDGIGEISHRLNDDGIESKTGETSSHTPWAAITKVVLTNDVILLMMKRSALYAPVSGFATRDEMLAFAKFATSKVMTSEDTRSDIDH